MVKPQPGQPLFFKNHEMKTYAITISLRFPVTHPRQGEQTHFDTSLSAEIKKHTIRGNYKFWKRRIDNINAGKAVLSVRVWTGQPYKSKQKELFQFGKGEVGIQKCDIIIEHFEALYTIKAVIDGNYIDANNVIRNDGLTNNDFYHWFKKKSLNDGCVIHFTDLKY